MLKAFLKLYQEKLLLQRRDIKIGSDVLSWEQYEALESDPPEINIDFNQLMKETDLRNSQKKPIFAPRLISDKDRPMT